MADMTREQMIDAAVRRKFFGHHHIVRDPDFYPELSHGYVLWTMYERIRAEFNRIEQEQRLKASVNRWCSEADKHIQRSLESGYA